METLYSSMRMVSDGTLQSVTLAFPYTTRTEIHVWVDGLEWVTGWDWATGSSNTIKFNTPVPAGSVVLIRRITQLDEVPYIFGEAAGSRGYAEFSAATVDANFDFILRASQDSLDSFQLTGIHAEAAETWAKRAEAAAVLAEDSEAGAAASASSANSYAQAAAQSASDSATSSQDSAQFAVASEDYSELSRKWAENPEDIPVVPGHFSAMHWATKAQNIGDLSNYLKKTDLLDPAQGTHIVEYMGRTQYDKNRETLSVKDFGAKGDGVTDDSSAFQSALDAANDAGGGVVFVPPGQYMFTGLSTLDLYPNITLLGLGGAVLDFSNRTGGFNDLLRPLIDVRGSPGDFVPLLATWEEGAWVVDVDTTTLAEGDLVQIVSNATVYGDVTPARYGEFVYVDEILSPTQFRANNSSHAQYHTVDSARLRKVNMADNITVTGLTIKGQGRLPPGNDGDIGLLFTYCRNVTVTNCHFIDVDMIQLEFRSCYGFLADNCTFYHTKYIDGDGATPGINRPIATAARGTVQYQVRAADCSMYGVVSRCRGEGSRHFFNTGHSACKLDGSTGTVGDYVMGLSRYVVVRDCFAKNTWHSCYSTHNDAEHIYFVSCVAENSGMSGFNPRCHKVWHLDCEARRCAVAYMLTINPTDVYFIGCRALYCNQDTTMSSSTYQKSDGLIVFERFVSRGSLKGMRFTPGLENRGSLIIRDCIINDAVVVPSGADGPLRVDGIWDLVHISSVSVDRTQASFNISVQATTPQAVVMGCSVYRGVRGVSIGSGVGRGIIANCVAIGSPWATKYSNSATTPVTQNNI